jgi:hypothetical protein
MTLISLAGACGEDQSACEAALDRLQACEVGRSEARGSSSLPLISSEDCSGENECLARCVAKASCAALIYGVKGHSTDPNEPPVPGGLELVACLDACAD